MTTFLMIGGDIILNEMIFGGDVNSLWIIIHYLKSQSLHFMKLVWQYKTDTSCLPILLNMLILQARKSKERLANILENDHICKLLKKSMSIIS